MQKTDFCESPVSQGITCSRKKTVALIKNVLGAQQFDDLVDIMQHNKFSICIDESTDLSTTKILSIVARVCIDFEAQDFLFALVKVTAADANTIYAAIVQKLNNSTINYKLNLIGFAADGAANMTGKNHSVATLLKIDCPNMIVLKCICHSFALCASYACLMLPSRIETFVRDIYNYVSNSPKRISEFEQIMILLDDKPKKLLHPVQTRWLSLEKVVCRILDLYEPLKIYFAMCYQVEKIDTAKSIFQNLEDPIVRLYLEFLKYILPTINKLNKMFQSEQPQIHNIHDGIKRLVCSLFDNFIKPEYLRKTKTENVDYRSPYNLIENEKLYLGILIPILLESN